MPQRNAISVLLFAVIVHLATAAGAGATASCTPSFQKSDATLQRDARAAAADPPQKNAVKDPTLATDGGQSFFPVSTHLYNTTLTQFLENQLNGWIIVEWAFDYWGSWYEDRSIQEGETSSGDDLLAMQADLDGYAQQAFPCNESSPTYGSDFMSTVNSTLGLNETTSAQDDPIQVTSELRRKVAESLQTIKERVAVLRHLVAASYMGVGFDGGRTCRVALNEYLENASEWDKAGASAAGMLLTLLPSLLTLGNLYVPKFSEAAAAGVFVSGASAVSALGLPVKSISVVGWRQRFDTESFTNYGRESIARLGRRVHARSHEARYRVRMKTLQAWYAKPSVSWSEDSFDGYSEPVRSSDSTREGEACENMFWKIRSRVIEGWPEREPFAPLMDSSTVLVSYFFTFFGTLLFGSAGIPMQLNSCDTRYYSVWLVCGTALSAFGKLYNFARRGHQILKFYPLSHLAKSTLTANLDLPYDPTATKTTSTSLPPLSRPTAHHYTLADLKRLLTGSGGIYYKPHGILYYSRRLLFRTRRATPAVPRLRPLTVLLHASSSHSSSSGPHLRVFDGLLAGLIFVALTILFGAQWGGNLAVVAYTVVAFLLVVAVARALCVWLVWRLARKADLHVVECAAGSGGGDGDEDDEVAGVARVLASMTGVLVVSGDGRSYYYNGELLNDREWWEGWRKDYVAGKLDGDDVSGAAAAAAAAAEDDVEQGQQQYKHSGQKLTSEASETAFMGITELQERL